MRTGPCFPRRCAVHPLTAAARSATSATSAPATVDSGSPGRVHHGALRISGVLRDGATVAATGLSWSKPRLPHGMTLLSFEVAYTWRSCAPGGKACTTAADSTATPFAAGDHVVGHGDTGRLLRVTE